MFALSTCPDPDASPDLRLTQFGEESPGADGFRDRLREHIGETEISMILGEVDASAAAVLVTGYLIPGAARRVTTVGCLRDEGFVVVHSPTKRNRLHVSVFPPVTEGGQSVEWDDKVAIQFNTCFTERVMGSEG
jgi:hypothetical protein